MEKMVDGTALKPVRCGCGGEAEVFHVAPEGYAGSYCVRCVIWTDFDEEDGSIKVNKIPYEYVVEMVCDWVGAGKVYNKDKWTQLSPLQYYNKVRSGRHFHPETEELILKFLNTIASHGLDEFHKMARCQNGYSYLRVDYEGEYVP